MRYINNDNQSLTVARALFNVNREVFSSHSSTRQRRISNYKVTNTKTEYNLRFLQHELIIVKHRRELLSSGSLRAFETE